MQIPVITYDVTLGDSLVGSFTRELAAGRAVEFIAGCLKAGDLFQPKDAELKYLPVQRTTEYDSVAAAEAAGLTVDYDTIIAQLAATQPAAPAPTPVEAVQP
jgi:hypothetical protein